MDTTERQHVRSQSEREELFRWYGWASPIGLGFFVVALAATTALLLYAAVLFRHAFLFG